ncbi:MAG TPA: phosphate acyltransferase, partial [Thermoanaerobaculaceae bacterium]|nr:phosphate acyltransferase [Thermoanaerobaculaceae bacterium]
MSGFVESLLDRARRARRRLVLSEGDDERVREAAVSLVQGRVGAVTLIGTGATASWAVREAPGVSVRIPGSDPSLEAVADHLTSRKPQAAPDRVSALTLAADPLRFAASLVALGEADATVGGAAHPTADVLRAALWAVGPASGIKTVSSCFYMVTRTSGVLTFADCGVVQYPTAEQLAEIAVAAARDRRLVVGDEPVVAFLSHSTRGSAEGESVDKVRRAVELFRRLEPAIPADGDLQGDAALVSSVALRKAPGSPAAGRANVLIFPDLDSGNIAYKLVQRIAQVPALGPVVQGLARPCSDLSRGATADDIVLVSAIALLQSQAASPGGG